MDFHKGVYVAATMLTVATTALAHHSYAMFDTTRALTVTGTVRTLEWAAPHVWLWVDVPNAGGGSDSYGFETVSPGQLQRDYGWDRHILHIGDRVTVDYAPLHSGKNGGELEKVTLANGKILPTRFTKGVATSGQPNGTAPAK